MRIIVLCAALSACGGGKGGDTAPSSDLEATPVATEAEPVVAPATVAADPGADAGRCGRLCERLIACMIEVGGAQPSDGEVADAKTSCTTRCDGEAEEDVAAANTCLTENPDSCPGLFQCVQALKSSE